MKILVFKIGALGDVLMSTPLLRQLRKNYPNAQIDYLIGNSSSIILKDNKNLDNVLKFEESIFLKKKFFKYFELTKKIKRRKYDVIFVLDKHWIFNLTAKLFIIKQRIGFDRFGKEGVFLTKKVHYEKIRHEIFYYLDLLKEQGGKVNYADFKMDIFLSKKNKEFANTFWKTNSLLKKKVIGIFPGGGNPADKWSHLRLYPVKGYISIIKKLLKNHSIILLGNGSSDDTLSKFILSKIKNKSLFSLVSKTSIHETAAISAKCFKVYCNDTGGMHIAAAVNKRIHSFFIVTHPLKKAPLWNESQFYWKNEKMYDPNSELKGDYSYYLNF